MWFIISLNTVDVQLNTFDVKMNTLDAKLNTFELKLNTIDAKLNIYIWCNIEYIWWNIEYIWKNDLVNNVSFIFEVCSSHYVALHMISHEQALKLACDILQNCILQKSRCVHCI